MLNICPYEFYLTLISLKSAIALRLTVLTTYTVMRADLKSHKMQCKQALKCFFLNNCRNTVLRTKKLPICLNFFALKNMRRQPLVYVKSYSLLKNTATDLFLERLKFRFLQAVAYNGITEHRSGQNRVVAVF